MTLTINIDYNYDGFFFQVDEALVEGVVVGDSEEEEEEEVVAVVEEEEEDFEDEGVVEDSEDVVVGVVLEEGIRVGRGI